MEAVRINQVSKTFGSHTAVSELSLAVPEGSVYGFIGPNGSGKTTTIRMILRVFFPDAGDIEVLGEDVSRAANDSIGYLPEERGLYKKMTVRRVLTYYGTLKGMSTRDARDSARDWLERLDLAEWENKKVETLSKGMSQKVQFISSVISKPKLLILDEPFSGLDPVNLEVLQRAILELSRSGTTIIFSTHDMGMTEKMCDFIFMIFKGKKVLDGTLDQIQQTYGSDTLRLRLRNPDALNGLRGVDNVIDMGKYQEVRFGGDPQELLKALAERTSIELFEVARPSLHDIFIRIAGPEAAVAEPSESPEGDVR